MFLRVEQGLSGLGQSVMMRQPGGRVLRVRMPIVLKRRGVGQLSRSAALALSGGAVRNIPSVAPTAVNFASAPGCNVVDLSKNECMLDDGTVTGCNIIQECDSLTGNARCQFGPFPGQAADPSLPFCTGTGPSVSFTPNPALKNPTGPSTPFTPTSVFAANSGAVLPSTSTARVGPATSSGVASQPATSSTPAPANQQTNFLTQLLGGSNPPAGAASSGSTTVVVQPGGGFFSDSASIFGVQIPYWLIGVVVVGGGFLLMSGGKK